MINNRYEINTMWFAATTREAAKKQARKYLKKPMKMGSKYYQ